MPPLRFVILRHDGIPDPHFDLMFELTPDAPLATWRSPVWPITLQVTVTQLPDHRQIYLDYEGPLSKNRGHVKRITAGTHTCHRTDDRLSIQFLTPEDMGAMVLKKAHDGQWTAWPG